MDVTNYNFLTIRLTKSMLPQQFTNEIIEQKNDTIIIRSSCQTEFELDQWLESFISINQLNYKRRSFGRNLSKIVCSRLLICRFSSRGKAPKVTDTNNRRGISLNAGCKSIITAKVLKMENIYTRDKLLLRKVPLPTKIIIGLTHSHLIKSASVLQFLKPKLDVKNKFRRYFEEGLSVSNAQKEHEKLFNNNKDFLIDRSINPTLRTIYGWYQTFRKEHFSNLNNKDLK